MILSCNLIYLWKVIVVNGKTHYQRPFSITMLFIPNGYRLIVTRPCPAQPDHLGVQWWSALGRPTAWAMFYGL